MRAQTAIGAVTALFAAGCSFPTKVFDNGTIDAATAAPDGQALDASGDGGSVAPRSAIASIIDLVDTDPAGTAVGLRGASINIEFADLSRGSDTSVFGTSPIDGCVVTRHTVGSIDPLVDAQPVTIAGGALAMPVGPCAFTTATAPYDCISQHATGAVTVTSTGGVVHYDVAGGNFNANVAGAYLDVRGFQNAVFNGRFPIGGTADSDSNGTLDELRVSLPTPPVAGTSETHSVTYEIVNGAGPIAATTFGVSGTFLASGNVEVSKGADPNWPAFDTTLAVPGAGFALSASSDQPTAFPTTARDLTFACSGAGCGPDVTPGTGQYEGLLIFGSTTDANVAGLATYAMPPPVASYVTIECNFPATLSGVLPSAAVSAILATTPKRIELTIVRGMVSPVAGPAAGDLGGVVVGHAIVGHTSF